MKIYQLKYYIGSFVVFFILSFFVLFFLEQEVRKAHIQELQNHEMNVVKLGNGFLGREFGMLVSDLNYLHHAYNSLLTEENNMDTLTDNWIEFSTHRGVYDQIRYIDKYGDEKIRINFDGDCGYIVPEDELQNKSSRLYFQETINLEEDMIYISPMDLNIEQGQVEEPYKPMIRLATPIYKGNDIEGILVLNYLAQNTLSTFRRLAQNSRGELILINFDGYRLSSADATQDWNFMFEEKKGDTFKKEYPKEWEWLETNSEGQTNTDNGLFTAMEVDLSQKYAINSKNMTESGVVFGDGNWQIVSVFLRNEENSAYFNDNALMIMRDVLKQNMSYFILLALASGVIGFLIHVNRKTYLRIKYYSEYDPLTKALNRRAGIAKLQKLTPVSERKDIQVSLCFLDINGLKEVNDTLGHSIGDELIKSVSDTIYSEIREQDFLIRLGGDEFLIVFEGIGEDKTEVIWERIVNCYDQINQNEARKYNISVSHGIVVFEGKGKTHLDDLISEADEKMYQEKKIIKAGLNIIKEIT